MNTDSTMSRQEQLQQVDRCPYCGGSVSRNNSPKEPYCVRCNWAPSLEALMRRKYGSCIKEACGGYNSVRNGRISCNKCMAESEHKPQV